MPDKKIRSYKLEKHDTKDIHDGHVNGFLIPAWRDWMKLFLFRLKWYM
jgi:hypothetical protein